MTTGAKAGDGIERESVGIDRLGFHDMSEEVTSRPVGFLVDALIRDEYEETPYTSFVLGVILGFFLLEAALAVLYTGGNTRHLVSFVFTYHPWVAWPLAPFLHRGLSHVAANVAFLYIAAPVENRMSTWQYVALLLFGGFLPLYAWGWTGDVFGTESHVAVYGASAFAFGLLGYGVLSHVGSEWRLTPRWWLIVLGGVSAVGLVGWDVVTSGGDPLAVNVGHLGGLLVGLVFGYGEKS